MGQVSRGLNARTGRDEESGSPVEGVDVCAVACGAWNRHGRGRGPVLGVESGQVEPRLVDAFAVGHEGQPPSAGREGVPALHGGGRDRQGGRGAAGRGHPEQVGRAAGEEAAVGGVEDDPSPVGGVAGLDVGAPVAGGAFQGFRGAALATVVADGPEIELATGAPTGGPRQRSAEDDGLAVGGPVGQELAPLWVVGAGDRSASVGTNPSTSCSCSGCSQAGR